MSDDFLGDRKKALEESFFAKQNAKLVEKLRVKRERQAAREGLARISGIADEAVLDALVELEIGPETWAAISLVPLIEVAWADGDLHPRERRAILTAAEANGVTKDSASWGLLESWLERRPDARLLEAWGQYMVALCGKLGSSERRTLENEVVGRARRVAQTAGGLLGLGSNVSSKEERALREIEKVFAK